MASEDGDEAPLSDVKFRLIESEAASQREKATKHVLKSPDSDLSGTPLVAVR